MEKTKTAGDFPKADYANALAGIITTLKPDLRNWGIQKIKNATKLRKFDDVSCAAQRVLDEGFDAFTVGDYLELIA